MKSFWELEESGRYDGIAEQNYGLVPPSSPEGDLFSLSYTARLAKEMLFDYDMALSHAENYKKFEKKQLAKQRRSQLKRDMLAIMYGTEKPVAKTYGSVTDFDLTGSAARTSAVYNEIFKTYAQPQVPPAQYHADMPLGFDKVLIMGRTPGKSATLRAMTAIYDHKPICVITPKDV